PAYACNRCHGSGPPEPERRWKTTTRPGVPDSAAIPRHRCSRTRESKGSDHRPPRPWRPEVFREPLLDAKVGAAGDLILCSHVFYYIDASEWLPNLERLVSWLSSSGVLVLVVQNHDTDCMRML